MPGIRLYDKRKIGRLYYDEFDKRYHIRYENGGNNGGFHCGDTIEILFVPGWTSTRFEYGDYNGGVGWYFWGLSVLPAEVCFYRNPVRA